MSDGVLTQSWRTRIMHKNRVDQLRCFRCGEEIQLGVRIHTNGGNIYTSIKPSFLKGIKVYHEACYEELFI